MILINTVALLTAGNADRTVKVSQTNRNLRLRVYELQSQMHFRAQRKTTFN